MRYLIFPLLAIVGCNEAHSASERPAPVVISTLEKVTPSQSVPPPGDSVKPLPDVARIFQSTNARFGEPEQRVIKSATDWKVLWADLHAGLPAPPTPVVDFRREVIVVVAMGPQSTGGADIDIIGTTQPSPGSVVVHVRESVPATGCAAPDMMSSPAVAARIPRPAGEVTFATRRVRTPC